MKPADLLIALPLALTACTPASAEPPFYGPGKAIDGDSLVVGQKEVRLFGIDAPEFSQTCKRAGEDWPCGSAAADQLSKLVTGKDVRCIQVDVDEHQRIVARCNVGGTDVNRTMVSSGYATAYRHYSTDYVAAEDSAKSAKRGLWGGTFEAPRGYRRATDEPRPQRRRAATARLPAAASGSCAIKGNRGSNGWIYHLPGMPFYSRTKAEEIFCSEAEAQAAGYRRAKVR